MEIQAMTDSPEELHRLYWTIALAIGMPLLTVVLVEAEQAQRRRDSNFRSVFRNLRLLFLPSIAAWLALTRIVGYAVEDSLPRIVATLADVSAIIVGLSLVNAILFSNVEQDSWQARTPRLLVDIVRLFLVVIGSAVVLSFVWGVDLGEMAAALGIGSIVIGLAVAEPLGNVFAGLMLLVERPISVGDWIKISDRIGQVTEINWRAIHLRTYMNELVVVPNAILAKESFTNFSRPSRMHCENITLGFSYDDPPNKVRATLLDLLENTPGVLAEPAPIVRVVNYGDFAIDYTATFFVADYLKHYAVSDTFLTRVWYAARREGISIPFPTAVEYSGEDRFYDEKNKPPIGPALAHASILACLSDSERARLESGCFWRSFAQNELIADEGSPLPGLFLIVKGRVRATRTEIDRSTIDLFEAGEGEIFGESVAHGNRTSESKIVALEDLECVVVRTEKLHEILMSSSRFACEVSRIFELRRLPVGRVIPECLTTFRHAQPSRLDEGAESRTEVPEESPTS
jgi:small-conductance mechanosensitive channel